MRSEKFPFAAYGRFMQIRSHIAPLCWFGDTFLFTFQCFFSYIDFCFIYLFCLLVVYLLFCLLYLLVYFPPLRGLHSVLGDAQCSG